MIVIPAVDILDGNVVTLVGGKPGTEKVTLPNPRQVAEKWESEGAPMIHVVDLNAAMDRGDNFNAIASILANVKVPIQIGGGIRTTEKAETFLNLGASRVVVGTRAVRDPEWLEELAHSNRHKIVLALDLKNGKVQVKGWKESSSKSAKEILERTEGLPLAGVLYTNIDVEGRAAGIDAERLAEFKAICPHPIIASGGITTSDDLRKLEEMGIESAIVGLALYAGTIGTDVWRVKE
ncbi:MAG TPA: 1-(5-phosphoribosyl)-5-[(5-phosphoribosylamino)methylideneamino]imidazole-4-carboxamide isomerase [Methanomassiliicoccaceae archaeon]|jgi:phosphoribosylformimino-5-aminoimidazole carboxamide ribotide isomerase|nr:1-(5-phosphoribosyl)-5-[(5-phosphoribosylamino)methylideneamino]imidazole-4-carboxamide isomerase [Euryarchaeota archaeon]HOB38596.1 1-(5-phosphoribosyl)-5-[(5-phosphoribosylamino)methylideneamino]imidazole-4-carboxamide isomerase [Methanomassiliicoccaceae archaeon]HOL08136.1 1-(5-phosphoribosyl)-5-[(5-phosphoribosylamino)methylideneamino]imidazole-4-carboxamide isomerase [Methanomassiliicoccaceae archaeon]HPT73513.1 1-(5-phosphoribosyl)-5-[(5-phosphoribosylamino)methylideneamino]imidazole-4-